MEARVALTLRTLTELSITEIARARDPRAIPGVGAAADSKCKESDYRCISTSSAPSVQLKAAASAGELEAQAGCPASRHLALPDTPTLIFQRRLNRHA